MITLRDCVLLLFLTLSPLFSVSAWTSTPFNPPSYPLAVRSPYLSAWLPSGGSGVALNSAWPQFWTGTTVGWAGFVKVDNASYSFLGDPVVSGAVFTKATQLSAQFTSTQSIFIFTAGPVQITVTFLSPIEPTDFVKQSLPLSYLSVSAVPTDGSSHSVSVYTDISGEWLTSNDTLAINWTTTTGDVLSHQSQLQTQTVYTESSDRILQGSVYYSTQNIAGTTYQTGQDIVVRAQFLNNGVLSNTQDTNFRAVSNEWPVFAFARSLGTVTTSSSQTALFSVGHVRDPVTKYIQNDGNTFQARSYYFWSTYSTIADAISAFLIDYSAALARAKALDLKLQIASQGISSAYADIVALSMRQTFGATELTISGSPGAWNTSDVLMFIKEISSDGNLNTVDIIMPAWPGFMYLNPTLGKYLLLPLLQYQATGQYPNPWAVHDLGGTLDFGSIGDLSLIIYAGSPIANGHNLGADEHMPVEESGNMINMILDYTQRTGDTSVATRYSGLLTQWANYLVANTLFPADQLSTTDFAGSLPNQTNLAIKGIIAIKAMSVISNKYLNNAASASSYSSTADSFLNTWQSFGISSDKSHLVLEYGNQSTKVLAYNLAMDKVLGLNFIPASITSLQSTHYANNLEKYGFPIDSRTAYTSSQWMIWAATTTSTSVRDDFISAIHSWLSSGLTSTPYGDRFEDDSGSNSPNKNRPVVGGNLALLLI
ncbi:hypothetical protein D9757_010466 [Collybiopsis confluens]|uniref:DUF1793-domain-containing protein n=1 Tax=Collybiopsis confluens TaxID=2823264 RepID=A0A8H5LUB1_9AGAR|nr:hypothetical protein D9757_010466 [Collybiopsis confluens]